MTAVAQRHVTNAADESSARSHIAEDLLLIAGLHDRTPNHDAIVALWSRCYDGLLRAGPFGSELRTAISRFCQSLTEIPSYVDDEIAATLAADFHRTYPPDDPGPGSRPTEDLEDGAGHTAPDVAAMRRWAQRRGHRVAHWRHLDPDHLSTQLRYLAHLVANDGIAAPVSGVHRYLSDRLLDWVEGSMKDMAGRSETNLYRDLAALTAAYIRELEQRFDQGLYARPGPSQGRVETNRIAVARPFSVESDARSETRC